MAPSLSNREEATAGVTSKYRGMKVLSRSLVSYLLPLKPQNARHRLRQIRESLRARLRPTARESINEPSLAPQSGRPLTAADYLKGAREALQESLMNRESFNSNTGVLLPQHEVDNAQLSKPSRGLRGGPHMRRHIAALTYRKYVDAEQAYASKVALESRRQDKVAEQARRIYYMRQLP